MCKDKTMKYRLEDFKTLDPVKGVPTISITRNGITFNQAAIIKLDKPEYVRFLLNEDMKVLAVVVCEKDDTGAMKFFSPDKKVLSVRIGNADLKNAVSDLMDWDLPHITGYRLKGEYDKEQKAVFFELDQADLMNQRGKNGGVDSEEGDMEEEV